MKTLCMDTAHKNLIVALYENDRMICGIAREAWKRQSEDLFPAIIECMEKAGWDSTDLDEVVITDGPGSYTGVRIAMTVAKVLCTRLNIPLYAISTLQLYAGLDPNALVLMDARSRRAYVGILEEGRFLKAPSVMTLEEIARTYVLPPRVLAAANGLKQDPEEGQVLFLPSGGNLYRVRGGETKPLLSGSEENFEEKNCTKRLYPTQIVLL